MKKTIAFLIAACIASIAYANCNTTSVITADGKVMVCTTCCYGGGQCQTTCM